jgi:hypothetical protein
MTECSVMTEILETVFLVSIAFFLVSIGIAALVTAWKDKK